MLYIQTEIKLNKIEVIKYFSYIFNMNINLQHEQTMKATSILFPFKKMTMDRSGA